MKEIWKEIKDYEELYWISDQGRVKNRHNKILKLGTDGKGYVKVWLMKDKKQKSYRIHRLVAEAFIPNPDNLPEVNHIDENKMNNNANNLEWCTRKENIQHSIKSGHITFNEKPIYCFDLDEEFASASAASVHTGVCRTSILKACRGQLTQAGGKLWCYAEDKDKKFLPK